MCDNNMPTSSPNQSGSIQSIQRLEVLGRRFSEAETRRLSTLQLRYQAQPDAQDLPMEVLRLRFARWLVECGWLGADDGSGFEKARGDGTPLSERGNCSHKSHSREGGASPEDPSGARDDPARVAAHGKHHPQRRLSLFTFWSRARRGSATGADMEREREREPKRKQNRPPDAKPCGPESPSGPCGPYSPFSPQPGADSHAEAQWYWIFLRHPW